MKHKSSRVHRLIRACGVAVAVATLALGVAACGGDDSGSGGGNGSGADVPSEQEALTVAQEYVTKLLSSKTVAQTCDMLTEQAQQWEVDERDFQLASIKGTYMAKYMDQAPAKLTTCGEVQGANATSMKTMEDGGLEWAVKVGNVEVEGEQATAQVTATPNMKEVEVGPGTTTTLDAREIEVRMVAVDGAWLVDTRPEMSPDPQHDEQAARAVVEAYLAALSDGDFAAACSALSEEGRELQLEYSVVEQNELRERTAATCEEGIEGELTSAQRGANSSPGTFEPQSVTFLEGLAEVHVRVTRPAAGGTPAQDAVVSVPLVWLDDTWNVRRFSPDQLGIGAGIE